MASILWEYKVINPQYSRQDNANTTLELSKVIDCANPAAFLKIQHVIKNVLDSRNFGLEIEPNRNEEEAWYIVCFNNDKYADDPVSYVKKCK